MNFDYIKEESDFYKYLTGIIKDVRLSFKVLSDHENVKIFKIYSEDRSDIIIVNPENINENNIIIYIELHNYIGRKAYDKVHIKFNEWHLDWNCYNEYEINFVLWRCK